MDRSMLSRSSMASRSGLLIVRTSWLKNPAPPSAGRSWRRVPSPHPRADPRQPRSPRRRTASPHSRSAAFSSHKSGSGEPHGAPPGQPSSTPPAELQALSSPSRRHRTSVSFSSSSAPSTMTEQPAPPLKPLVPKPGTTSLPSLEGVDEVVISKQVVEGAAPPLYIYADRSA